MITSIYYYNYYKPNILKNSAVSVVKQAPFKQNVHYNNTTKPISLSTAYKDDVLDYVKNLSDAVNSTKVSATNLLELTKDIEHNQSNKDLKEQKKKRTESEMRADISKYGKKLSDSLNKSINFSSTTSQSEEFDEFSKNLKMKASNSKSLEEIGLTFDTEFSFSDDALNDLNYSDVKNLFKNATSDINDLYDMTNDFLKKPLSSHMSFKSFSYYYSYTSGIIKTDSFNIISRGTILDLEL